MRAYDKRLAENFAEIKSGQLRSTQRTVKIGQEESEFLLKYNILDVVNSKQDITGRELIDIVYKNVPYDAINDNMELVRRAVYLLYYCLFGFEDFNVIIWICDTVEKDWTLDVRARLSSWTCENLFGWCDNDGCIIETDLEPKDFNLPYDLHFSYYDKYEDEEERESEYDENLYNYVNMLELGVSKQEYEEIILPKLSMTSFAKGREDMLKDILDNCKYVVDDGNRDYRIN